MSIDALLKDSLVQSIFKSIRIIESTDIKDFAYQISLYIDAAPMSFSDHNGKPPFWPLVKQVTVYINSPAISSGVSLIDLPGVGDTNSARSEQASKFLPNAMHFGLSRTSFERKQMMLHLSFSLPP